MSINLATMGMFQSCCGRAVGGGGAPPYRRDNEEVVRPFILVKKVETKNINLSDSLTKEIKVTLVD
jgi:hypothetical protein